jgi:hypothetical protein
VYQGKDGGGCQEARICNVCIKVRIVGGGQTPGKDLQSIIDRLEKIVNISLFSLVKFS